MNLSVKAGKARCGMSRLATVGCGLAGTVSKARSGKVGLGKAGGDRRGVAWFGEARQVR